MKKNKVAMIPARLGSQRLPKKNLENFGEMTLLEFAIDRCKRANVFDEIYVNSESLIIGDLAKKNNVKFYKRKDDLANNVATSEEFVYDFLKNIDCDELYQVHSITPLLTDDEIINFVKFCSKNHNTYDTVLSCIEDQIEVSYKNSPINFSFDKKTNSQDLLPVQRITWSITKWRSDTYIDAVENGKVGTYSGDVGFYPVSALSGIPVKTAFDLKLVNALRGLKP